MVSGEVFFIGLGCFPLGFSYCSDRIHERYFENLHGCFFRESPMAPSLTFQLG